MTATTAGHPEDTALVAPFRRALLGVIIMFVFVGGLIAAYGTGSNRPEGVAERWLANVGDTRRDGVREKARSSAEKVGPVSLAAAILPTEGSGGDSAFADLEVGKASGTDAHTVVPFRLHQELGDSASKEATYGVVQLEKVGKDWKVTGVFGPQAGLKVPSDGGSPASKAPWTLFAGTLAVAVLITAIAAALLRAAGKHERDPAPT
jgi:hypothetical protein